jgi:hypothetical protein
MRVGQCCQFEIIILTLEPIVSLIYLLKVLSFVCPVVPTICSNFQRVLKWIDERRARMVLLGHPSSTVLAVTTGKPGREAFSHI